MYRKIVYLMIASVIIIHLLLTPEVLCDYETIWNAYFERPCCEKDFMKYHSGKSRLFTSHNDSINWKKNHHVCSTENKFSLSHSFKSLLLRDGSIYRVQLFCQTQAFHAL